MTHTGYTDIYRTYKLYFTFSKNISFIFQQNIVCDDKENLPVYKSLFFAGVLVGALGLGILSDKYVLSYIV